MNKYVVTICIYSLKNNKTKGIKSYKFQSGKFTHSRLLLNSHSCYFEYEINMY